MRLTTRILIIEQDVALINQMSAFFSGKGYEVEKCNDSGRGLMMCLNQAFDLVLLGINLPSCDGITLLTRLRQSKKVPVIVLSNQDSVSERIELLEKGADDYFLKTLNLAELCVRVEALLRRIYWTSNYSEVSNHTLVVDKLSLSRVKQTVTYDGEDISLTPIQFRLLWVLVENRNEVLSKPYLYQTVLDRAFKRYDRSLDMHFCRVRRKLVDSGLMQERFSTIHGKGYRFA